MGSNTAILSTLNWEEASLTPWGSLRDLCLSRHKDWAHNYPSIRLIWGLPLHLTTPPGRCLNYLYWHHWTGCKALCFARNFTTVFEQSLSIHFEAILVREPFWLGESQPSWHLQQWQKRETTLSPRVGPKELDLMLSNSGCAAAPVKNHGRDPQGHPVQLPTCIRKSS